MFWILLLGWSWFWSRCVRVAAGRHQMPSGRRAGRPAVALRSTAGQVPVKIYGGERGSSRLQHEAHIQGNASAEGFHHPIDFTVAFNRRVEYTNSSSTGMHFTQPIVFFRWSTMNLGNQFFPSSMPQWSWDLYISCYSSKSWAWASLLIKWNLSDHGKERYPSGTHFLVSNSQAGNIPCFSINWGDYCMLTEMLNDGFHY